MCPVWSEGGICSRIALIILHSLIFDYFQKCHRLPFAPALHDSVEREISFCSPSSKFVSTGLLESSVFTSAALPYHPGAHYHTPQSTQTLTTLQNSIQFLNHLQNRRPEHPE
jgi:hypothetical protein